MNSRNFKLTSTLVATLLIVTVPLALGAGGKPGGGGGGYGGGGGGGGGGNNNSGNSGNSGSSTPTTPPKYVDPITNYMNLYDTNHDGRLDKDELKKMSILDPTAYAQATAFVDKTSGGLGVQEIDNWRKFLRAQWSANQAKSTSNNNGGGSGG